MYGSNNLFCLIENGIIYQVDTYNRQQIGYTNESYSALEATTQQYYDKLVELGVIVPPKSQEEINADLQKALTESQSLNRELLEMMKELKGGLQNEQSNNGENQSDVSKQQPNAKSTGGSKPSKSSSERGVNSETTT